MMEDKHKPASRTKYLLAILHFLSLLPLFALIWAHFRNALGFNPIETALRQTGRLAVLFLLLSLTCTPIKKIFKQPTIGPLRKPLGLYAALYAGLHFSTFVLWDYQLNLSQIWLAVAEKPFILIGLAALLILTVLSVTSFGYWQRKLGKKRGWLHRGVYLAGLLAILHYLLAVKGNLFMLQGNYVLPLIAAGVLSILLVLRVPRVLQSLQHWNKRG